MTRAAVPIEAVIDQVGPEENSDQRVVVAVHVADADHVGHILPLPLGGPLCSLRDGQGKKQAGDC